MLIKWTGIWLLSFLIPAVGMIIMIGKNDVGNQELGVKVTMENGETMDGEQYVMGMAASELSYIREEEAVKAWMIVCRTNFMKAVGSEKTVREQELPFDFVSMEELEQSNGRKKYLEVRKSIKRASYDTFSKVITYEGKPIDALYHEVSAGKTISSQEAYGNPISYLTGVESNQDVESAEYMNVRNMTFRECSTILKKTGVIETPQELKKELRISKQTENGYVKEVRTDHNQWTGEDWKKIFSLTSPIFYLEEHEGKLRIVSLGKGHNMGMSLYGANVLGKHYSMEQILHRYYPGTTIKERKVKGS